MSLTPAGCVDRDGHLDGVDALVAGQRVGDRYEHGARVVGGHDVHRPDHDPLFPGTQRGLDLPGDRRTGRRSVRLHQVPAQPAAEIGPHHPLAWLGVQNDQDRLPHQSRSGQPLKRAVRTYLEREGPASAERVGAGRRGRGGRGGRHRRGRHGRTTSLRSTRLAYITVLGGATLAANMPRSTEPYEGGSIGSAAPDLAAALTASASDWPLRTVPPSRPSTLASKTGSALMVATAPASMLRPPPMAVSSAPNPPPTSTSGGMQKRSVSRNQSWKTNTTIGRNSENTKKATIVISGIANEQIWKPPPVPLPGWSALAFMSSEVNGSCDPGGVWKR